MPLDCPRIDDSRQGIVCHDSPASIRRDARLLRIDGKSPTFVFGDTYLPPLGGVPLYSNFVLSTWAPVIFAGYLQSSFGPIVRVLRTMVLRSKKGQSFLTGPCVVWIDFAYRLFDLD